LGFDVTLNSFTK